MQRSASILILCFLLAVPMAAQQDDTLAQAQQVLTDAENAGAMTYAPALLEEAAWRIRFAQENWNHSKRETREQARMRAMEALWSGRAAVAKSRWLGTNMAIKGLQDDITRFGGRADVMLAEEPPGTAVPRNLTPEQRLAAAQTAIDRAKGAGAATVAAQDLKNAQEAVETARKIISANKTSDSAEYLAYTAEMMANRSYYVAQMRNTEKYLPDLQLQRTKLAQTASERQAAEERTQREFAERQAADLQRKLAEEQANRQAQSAELDQLRNQVEANRRAVEEQLAADRTARTEASQRLDTLMSQYETSLASGAPADLEALRRQVEDQQIALRSVEDRARGNEAAMTAELERLRTDFTAQRNTLSADVARERELDLQRRETDLERLRRENLETANQRAEAERRHQAAVEEANRLRAEADERASQMRLQVEQAQQAAQEAQAAAQQAVQQSQQQGAQLEQMREENRRLRLEQELARLASTRSDARGLIVTLPGIFFDTGKTQLKAGARATLAKIATQIKAAENLRVSVEGHTDSVGSEATNQKLSDARANAVRDELVKAGVPADRITAAGRGEGQPIATNNTAAGRQQNRRVELIIAP